MRGLTLSVLVLLLMAGVPAAWSQSIVADGNIETGAQLVSSVAMGTAPLAVSSTTVVLNLNADQVDGLEASAFALESDLQALVGDLSDLSDTVAAQRGVVFTRWGRSDCPVETSLVYSGFAAGSRYNQSGGGSNSLCLTSAPTWDGFSDMNQDAALLWGTEYEMIVWGLAGVSPFDTLHNDDAPCAVCLDAQADVELMLPGSQLCPSGWNTRVQGYLMATHYLHQRTEFVCVDRNAEAVPGSETDHDGHLWYPTEAECGALPCGTGEYVQDREITCAICTR